MPLIFSCHSMLVILAIAIVALSRPGTAKPLGGALEKEIANAVRGGSGRIGVAFQNLQSSQTWHLNGREQFPMQSIFKAILAVEVLQQVDAGKLSLEQPVTIDRGDLAMQWSPISSNFAGTTQSFTIRELLQASVGMSDNTAADVLMELVGGPAVVTKMLRNAGIDGIQIDRYERQFQPELVGLPAFPLGQTIDQAEYDKAVEAVSEPVKRTALERYISAADPRDTATPLGAVEFLSKLQGGDLLSSTPTNLLLRIMTESPTGANRLKKGLPPGSTMAHKTGTSGDFLGINAATNHMGIVTLPGGRKFSIAVFLAGSKKSEADRDAAHAAIARAVVQALTAPEPASDFQTSSPAVAP